MAFNYKKFRNSLLATKNMENYFNMKKIKYFIFIIIFSCFLSGCAGTMYDFKEEYNKRVNPPIDWHQRAELYTEIYPYCSNNEKAFMLARDMKYEGELVTMKTKIYKVKVIHVYNYMGKQIWPINKKKKQE